jgi:uncharacterized phage protein gp47/JayE
MYAVKTFEEALETMQDSAREQFGDDFNVSNTSNWYRLVGLPVSLLCVEKSQNIKDLEDRMSIYKATGTDLDDILSNFRFSRKQSSAATGTWTTSNSTPNTIVPIGALTVERATDGITYKNTNAVTIDSLGVGVFEIECETSGTIGNCDIGEIDKITTPVSGISSGSNTDTLEDGQDQETDLEYLSRYLEASSTEAFWNLDGIYSEILSVDGVTSAYVNCNRENVIDSNGWLPHSRIYIVDGGTEQDIAEAIYRKTDRAIAENGSVSVTVTDIQGIERIVKFDRPVTQIVDFKVTVLPESTNITNIIAAIKSYIDSISIGGLITQTNAVEAVRSAGYLTGTGIQSLEVKFALGGTGSYNPTLQLVYNKKPSGNLVT